MSRSCCRVFDNSCLLLVKNLVQRTTRLTAVTQGYEINLATKATATITTTTVVELATMNPFKMTFNRIDVGEVMKL